MLLSFTLPMAAVRNARIQLKIYFLQITQVGSWSELSACIFIFMQAVLYGGIACV